MTQQVQVKPDVNLLQVCQWLHDHVGTRISPVEGEGWQMLLDPKYLGVDLGWTPLVVFDDHVSPDVITQFMLTWT
jgi:hypothetical protein